MAKIKNITRKSYKGKVHDLTVPDLSAYNVEGLSVHNSGAGSLCLYVLGITKIDPLQYNLLFERFINPERVSPPDVDIDFDYARRDEIFDYIIRKYGNDYCCKIGTYMALKPRSTIKYAAKALDIGGDWERYQSALIKDPSSKPIMTKKSLELADFIAKQIPSTPGMTIKQALTESQEFKKYMERYPSLYNAAVKMEGMFSSSGVHPAGIIICKENVSDHLPMRNSKGVICSQLTMEEVDALGLLKFDMLALKTLTLIERTVNDIKKRYGIDVDVDSLEPTDKKVLALFNGDYKNMDNRGIFQFESPGISALLKNIHIDSFNDLIVCNALYRPGPMKAGVHDLYCDYKHGRQPIKYLHPKMGEVLDETYGIMCFQEDITRVVQKLAGFTLGQADWLRKVIGKKKIELIKKENLDTLFFEGCKKESDIDAKTSKAIFEQIEFFGGYGFNKCLSGDTMVKNLKDGEYYRLCDLEERFFNYQGWNEFGVGSSCEKPEIVLNSLDNGKVVEDVVEDVFEVGERELFEVELDNNIVLRCTMDHKFICSDGQEHTLEEIIDNGLEIWYE